MTFCRASVHPRSIHPDPGPLPIMIGVTGHRDIVEGAIAPLCETVGRIFDLARRTYPHSPIQVVSALAEGADQLAADVALARGMPLVALAPMPIDDYALTFDSAEGRERLRALWAAATLRIELPWATGDRDAPHQYEQAGMIINRASHILLAWWDGHVLSDDGMTGDTAPPLKKGGTAHVVHLRLRGDHAAVVPETDRVFLVGRSRLHPPENEATLRFACPRRSHSMLKEQNVAGMVWRLGLDADDGISQIPVTSGVWPVEGGSAVGHDLFHLDQANRLLAEVARRHAPAVERSAERLLPRAVLDGLTAQAPMIGHLRTAHALADVLAQINQRRIYRVLFFVVFALLTAVLAFELFAHTGHSTLPLTVYLLAVIGPALAHGLLVRPGQWQNRFQDFRALAEALRVQLFWGLGGVAAFVTDHYLNKHRLEMNWIRQGVRGVAVNGFAIGLGPVHSPLVQEYWIKDQLRYFGNCTVAETGRDGMVAREDRRHRRLERLSILFYWLGVMMAIGILALQLSSVHLDHDLYELAVIAMGFTPALAAALSIYAEKRSFKDHAHQYFRIATLFDRAAALLSNTGSDRSFRLVIRDLGIDCLAENGDWLIAHRDRPVGPIRGG